MSHAVYAFLCKGDDPVSSFDTSSFYDQMDENNWYQAMAAVNKKGEVTNLCPESDYRQRTWLQKTLGNEPQETVWQKAVKFAQDIVLYEIGQRVFYLTPEDERDYGKEFNFEGIDRAIAALREKLAQTVSQADSWAISSAGSVLEQCEGTTGPFTRRVFNAYSTIRAVALDEEVSIDDEDAVILFVDIHT